MGKISKLKRGDLRDALVEYAMQACKDGHIEVMSLRKAARDLGVSSGAVYRHFADKDALFYEVVKIGFSDLRERFVAIRAEGDKATSREQALKRCFMLSQTYICWANENTALWHMMFGRIGMLCRNETMQNSDLSRYTPFDVSLEVTRDLFTLGLLEKEPDMSDIRFIWSATHGAADLAQSGARMDHTQLDKICADTTVRCLRSIGFEMALPKAPAQQ
ncbi:MAG: TetR/AcrR family transcriptional regulator [Rhodobacteraceae bacterium]|nr:TetR/AcrR family transcriptional regulator [Paracoccaceae bacterium]